MFKKGYFKWIIATVIAILIFTIYCLRHEIFDSLDNLQNVYKILTNSLFVDSVIMIGIGLLIFASNEGTFDIFIYGFQSFVNMFRKNKAEKKYDSFYDYRVAHESQKISFLHFIIIGLILLGLMFIARSLYYQ